MSNILSSVVLVPGSEIPVQPFTSPYYSETLCIEKTKALSIDSMLASLPDQRALRSMSRSGLLLSLSCLELQAFLKPFLDVSPFSVGIYCAMENGPVDLKTASLMLGVPDEAFAERYRKAHNPKMFLMQLPNLAAAQMGIFLGITGPMNVFNSSGYGSIHALEQAEDDLHAGRVSAALVCSAFSFENPLVLERIHRQKLGSRVLCEGAAAILLTADGVKSKWDDNSYDTTESYYGISHQLVVQITKKGRFHVD
jgi:3-oxoacyl-(acyl-carrier-protein) synthase